MNDANQQRLHRRSQFLTGISRNTKKPFKDDTWYKANIKPLLDAHYACSRPVRSVVLNDVETMLADGYAKITVIGERSDKELTPRKLLPVEKRLIKEWYDEKMEKLREEVGPETVEREREDRAAQRAQTDEIQATVRAEASGLHTHLDQRFDKLEAILCPKAVTVEAMGGDQGEGVQEAKADTSAPQPARSGGTEESEEDSDEEPDEEATALASHRPSSPPQTAAMVPSKPPGETNRPEEDSDEESDEEATAQASPRPSSPPRTAAMAPSKPPGGTDESSETASDTEPEASFQPSSPQQTAVLVPREEGSTSDGYEEGEEEEEEDVDMDEVSPTHDLGVQREVEESDDGIDDAPPARDLGVRREVEESGDEIDDAPPARDLGVRREVEESNGTPLVSGDTLSSEKEAEEDEEDKEDEEDEKEEETDEAPLVPPQRPQPATEEAPKRLEKSLTSPPITGVEVRMCCGMDESDSSADEQENAAVPLVPPVPTTIPPAAATVRVASPVISTPASRVPTKKGGSDNKRKSLPTEEPPSKRRVTVPPKDSTPKRNALEAVVLQKIKKTHNIFKTYQEGTEISLRYTMEAQYLFIAEERYSKDALIVIGEDKKLKFDPWVRSRLFKEVVGTSRMSKKPGHFLVVHDTTILENMLPTEYLQNLCDRVITEMEPTLQQSEALQMRKSLTVEELIPVEDDAVFVVGISLLYYFCVRFLLGTRKCVEHSKRLVSCLEPHRWSGFYETIPELEDVITTIFEQEKATLATLPP